jgi:hypothetical protein
LSKQARDGKKAFKIDKLAFTLDVNLCFQPSKPNTCEIHFNYFDFDDEKGQIIKSLCKLLIFHKAKALEFPRCARVEFIEITH